jgi:predicted transcriptional regulator
MKQAQYTKSLTISMPPEHYEQIKQITDEQQISMAEWVRDAVNASLERYQSQTDAIDDK